ncbi:hypothetical protein CDD83_6438 [Cordyceps sp. RAO-2017]|nr:hypothetical protein CDD83_6438 [Cordyceps sp. RAO-2017]
MDPDDFIFLTAGQIGEEGGPVKRFGEHVFFSTAFFSDIRRLERHKKERRKRKEKPTGSFREDKRTVDHLFIFPGRSQQLGLQRENLGYLALRPHAAFDTVSAAGWNGN